MSLTGTHWDLDVTRPVMNRITRSDFVRFRADLPVNRVGSFQVDFMPDDYDLQIDNGDLVILYRSDPNNPDTHIAFTGIHRISMETHSGLPKEMLITNRPEGYQYLRNVTSHGHGLNDVLALPYILWPSETPEAVKNADVITVIDEYVEENLGITADPLNGRYAFNNNVLLTLPPPPAVVGLNWEGDSAEKPLFRTLQGIAAYALTNGIPLITEIVQPNPTIYAFQFNLRQPTDHSVVGLNPANGRNGVGNNAVLLSLGMGNITEITQVIDFGSEYNQITALGQGISTERRFRTRAVAGLNAINRRERIINGTEQETDQQLDDLADSWLEQLSARPSYAVQLNHADVQLWRDFQPHDIVSLEYAGTIIPRVWVTNVSIDIARRGTATTESVALELTVLD